MSDWEERLKAAEAGAERTEALEQVAEERFDAVHAKAHAQGDASTALLTEEFRTWMASRRATDEAWGGWAQVMDAKAGA
jgi:hypothetical protein